MTGLDRESVLKVSPSVYARAFGEELVLLDFGRGEYFGLDPIGAEAFRLLEAGRSLGAIADAIVERYEVSHDVALRDVLALVDDMLSRALVEEVVADTAVRVDS